nr:Fis family transcriptional regulator [Bacillota bacterium]
MSKPRVAVLTHSKLTQMLKEVLAEMPWSADVALYDVLLEEAVQKARQLEESGQADVLVTGGANATVVEAQGLTLPVVRIKVTG